MTTTLLENNSLNKLSSKEFYLILVDANTVKPRQPKIIARIFLKHCSLNGKKKILNCNTTLDTNAHMFQYKVYILFTNKMLFETKKVISTLTFL